MLMQSESTIKKQASKPVLGALKKDFFLEK